MDFTYSDKVKALQTQVSDFSEQLVWVTTFLWPRCGRMAVHIMDGPDEVHKRAIAQSTLRRYTHF